jgi:Fe-S oxidoreductase
MDRLEKYEDWARACMHVRCGFCRENCPVYSQLKLDSYAAKGKMTILYHLLKGTLELDGVVTERVFACTSCGLCDVACGYNQSEAIQEMKTFLYDHDVAIPDGYQKISTKIRESGNPYSADTEEGSQYLQSIPESNLRSADYILFLGCTQIYREQGEIEALLRILRAAEVHFTTQTNPVCCGSPAYRVGDTSQARLQAELVSEMLTKSENVLVSCAGCFRMLSHDYQHLLDKPPTFETVHHLELLLNLIQDNKFELSSLNKKVTYHDPCHLGRHSGFFDEPRELLESITGLELVEMEWNRKFAKCCGAGGGFKAGKGDDAIAIAANRVREAETTGASILVTSCPFCLRNLQDGAASLDSTIKVQSVTSLIAELLPR